jgi:hypothetical protein
VQHCVIRNPIVSVIAVAAKTFCGFLTFSSLAAKLNDSSKNPCYNLPSGNLLLYEKEAMNPFELFQSSGIYKMAILYFSRSRGLAIVGRCANGDKVEVVQISGEVDPHTGNFTALDYIGTDSQESFPLISKKDFESLVSFIEAKIDDQTRMSIIEPEVIKSCLSEMPAQDIRQYVH